MSQAQDMAAIYDLFARTTPTNAAASALRDAFADWYSSLTPYERDYDSDSLYAAKLRRDAFNTAMTAGAVLTADAPAPVVTLTPKPTIQKGSRDPAGSTEGPVHEWQAIVGASPVDGIFGSNTESKTKDWQKAHGLVADGIVGPLTWAQALANSRIAAAMPTTATAAASQAAAQIAASMPAPAASTQAVSSVADATATQLAAQAAALAAQAASAPTTAGAFPVIRNGSTGAAVRNWQAILGVPVDGVFGAETEAKTKAWQAAHGLTADGIVGPATWTAAAMPGSVRVDLDPIGTAVSQAGTAVLGAFQKAHTLTPTWLKATGAVLLGWSALLLFTHKSK